MVDEKPAGDTATAEPGAKGALESAVEKVREQKEDSVPFKVLTEENLSGARRKIQVEVDRDQWETRLEDLFKKVKNQASLPGFRKGKAPLSLLKKRYREGAIHELVEKVSPMIIRDYEADKKLTVYGTPAITEYNAEQGKPATITYEMEIKPEIKPKDYKGIEFESADYTVESNQLDDRLTELREQAAVYNEVDRGWQAGDGIVIDYKITGEQGKTLSHRSNQFIENPQLALPEEIVEELDGKKTDDQFDKKIQETTYNISVKSVKEKSVPELNDEFAKDLGYADVAELRTKTQEELENSARNARDDEAFEALTLKLVETHEFDIPEALKQHVEKEMAETDMQYLRQTGYRPPRLANVEQPEDYSKVLEKDAVQRVKGFLLIDAIGQAENIEISEEDINKALEAEAAQAGRKPVAVRASLERNKQWPRFLEQVRFEKIRDFLLKENKPVFVKKEEEPEAEGDAKTDDTEKAKKPAKAKSTKAKDEKTEKAETKAKADKAEKTKE